MSANNQATEFWDREIHERAHVPWMEHLSVRLHINALISGEGGTWPLEWFEKAFAARLPFTRALSIGCGTGILERQLISRGDCRSVDALDGSLASLSVAQTEAAREGLPIRYFLADFDRLALRGAHYDAVFFHHSLHHVKHLERLFGVLLRSMTPGAILYLDEYIGPSRYDWNDALIRPHRAIFAGIPRAQRLSDVLELPVQEDDPSEAIRSSEILPQLRIGFDTLAQRDYGGNVLSVLFPQIVQDDSLIDSLITEDVKQMRADQSSYHTVLVATPKLAWRGLMGRMRYWLEPKVRTARLRFLTWLGRPPARW